MLGLTNKAPITENGRMTRNPTNPTTTYRRMSLPAAAWLLACRWVDAGDISQSVADFRRRLTEGETLHDPEGRPFYVSGASVKVGR